MAEAFARVYGKGKIEPFSAGSRPSWQVNPMAIESMREVGYDLSTHRSKSLSELPDLEYDLVVTMGCGDQCPWVRAKERRDWELPDPKTMSLDEARRLRNLIQSRVKLLIDRSRSVEFFEGQFQRQVKSRDFQLNPFERLALDYVHGATLDLGCGMGNLALESARRGCTVTAIDASPTAIARIRETAQEEHLPVEATEAELTDFRIGSEYDTIVAIGLLMFFPKSRALAMLRDIQARVRPGGRAIVNVLIEGTTYLDMFTPGEYYLFRREELIDRFADWVVEVARYDDFPAAVDSVKAFVTLIARKPSAGG